MLRVFRRTREMRLGGRSQAVATTLLAWSKKITSIGNFIPIVWTPLLGISHRASSGPRLFRRNKPTRRVRNWSAFLTVVANQVFLVKFSTGIGLFPRKTSKHPHNIDGWRP